MANINDIIGQIVNSAAGKVEIPANVKDQVLGGLSSSILGSLTQTATPAGGLEEIKASSPAKPMPPPAISPRSPATFSIRTGSAN